MKRARTINSIATAAAFLLLTRAGVKAQEPGPSPLQGSVQAYASRSKPLDPLLWPGNTFDKAAARSLLRNPEQERAIWQRIPKWQAGTWTGKQAVNTRAIKYINGAAVESTPIGVHTAISTFRKGLLKDRKGDIWHLFNSDYFTQTDHGNEIQISYVQYSSPGSAEFPDLYAESVDFNVDKTNNQIMALRRAKVWTRYLNLSDGIIKEETLRTNFDKDGQPTATSFNTALEKRSEPFSAYEASFASHKAIVESFHNYLRQHGMANLIAPDKGKAPPAKAASHKSH